MAAADYRLLTEATGQRIAAALEALSGTGAAAAAARTNLDVYSKGETDNAIAQSTAVVVPADSLFSSRHANVSEIKARRAGNVMLVSVILTDGVPNNAALFTIDTTIQPPAANIITPLYKQNNGELVTYGSVWVESSNNRIVRYYGTQATAGLTCFSFTYIIG